MNFRLLQFYSNLVDVTQAKDLVNGAKDISAGIRNRNECKRFNSGRANCCHLSSCPELSREQRAHTPVHTLTHVWNETTGFPGKKTHVQTRSVCLTHWFCPSKQNGYIQLKLSPGRQRQCESSHRMFLILCIQREPKAYAPVCVFLTR